MRLRKLLENFTPEQEAEQASWRTSPYKIPFPGKEKKKKSAKPSAAAPDPFDTKPVPPKKS